jgi:hypothetical protein
VRGTRLGPASSSLAEPDSRPTTRTRVPPRPWAEQITWGVLWHPSASCCGGQTLPGPRAIPQAATLTAVTYPTAKHDLDRLRGLGILSEGPPDMTPRYFYSPQLFDIAYGDSLIG